MRYTHLVLRGNLYYFQCRVPVTSRVELGKLSRPFSGGTNGFVPSCNRRIAPLKQPGTNG